jgi:hypothetical protein
MTNVGAQSLESDTSLRERILCDQSREISHGMRTVISVASGEQLDEFVARYGVMRHKYIEGYAIVALELFND